MIDRRQFIQAAGAGLITPTLASCSGVDKVAVPGVPDSGFGKHSTAEDVTHGLNLEGKVAVVTGCTAGIGFETMRVLATRGAMVVGTSRSLERAGEACNSVTGLTMPVQLDLGDFDSVARCADVINDLQTPVDMLICNAGYRGGGNERQLINGIEKHFVINHLGHFILTNRLMGRLYAAEQGRAVIVSSRTAYTDAPDEGIMFDDLEMSADYSDRLAYGHSKLANALFSLKLAELVRGTPVTSNALHPGVIDTELDRNLSSISRFAWSTYLKLKGKTVGEGAATTCYVATIDELGAVSGQFFEDCNAVIIRGQGHIQNMAMADELFEKSIELTSDWLVGKEPAVFNAPRKEEQAR
jgi:NAD(P)-dependent dehydrogenase (short-subunit alcohol dehydrogenase family)